MRFLLCLLPVALAFPVLAKPGRISANVSAGSELYDDLDRLEAYGCAEPTFRALRPQSYFDLHDALPEAKPDQPETCTTAPAWLLKERAILQKEIPSADFVSDAYFTHDDSTPLLGLEASVTPLYPLREGRPLFNGPNLYNELSLMGEAGKDFGFAFGITPGFMGALDDYQNLNGRFYLQEAYLKVGYRRFEFTFGRTALRFGEAKHGSLLFSAAAAPLNLIKFSLRPHHIHPFRFLGPFTLEAWVAGQGDSRFVKDANLFGVQGGFRPASWLELAFVELFQYGGQGKPGLSSSDFLRMAFYSNGDDLILRRHRSMALNLGIWGPSSWVKLYAEILFDQLNTQDTSSLIGLWFPKVGEWELRIEHVNTQPGAYQSPYWQQGFVYNQTSLGHPLGSDADGTYVDLGFPTWNDWRPLATAFYEARYDHPRAPFQTERRVGGGLELKKRWEKTELQLSGRYAALTNSLYTPGVDVGLFAATVTLRYTFF